MPQRDCFPCALIAFMLLTPLIVTGTILLALYLSTKMENDLRIKYMKEVFSLTVTASRSPIPALSVPATPIATATTTTTTASLTLSSSTWSVL
ncbi:hypothetical protein VTN00DRAFT_5103 [Thermoascus crustaceus]|uniref:uncharacterized protein n=1 Tax=Thermoascus crustaceus TaxID=5088 RepID=UPI0037420A1F